MTTAWINAQIYTGEGFAQALLVKDELIAAVGTSESILSLQPENIIDLQGDYLQAGFHDSHMHLCHVGESLQSLDLSPARSIEDLIELGRNHLEKYPELRSKVLAARGWNQDLFKSPRFPTKEDLDQISRDIPIFFERVCGHVATLNSKALAVLGLTPHSPSPEGGEIVCREGELSGILTETALTLLQPLRPKLSKEDYRSMYLRAFSHAVKHGLTSIQSNDLSIGSDADLWELLREMDAAGEIPLRLTQQLHITMATQLEPFFEREDLADSPHLSLGQVKVFKDGSLGGRTALMLGDYSDAPGWKGTLALSDTDHEKILRAAEKKGLSLITHTIGDGALEKTLDIYEKADKPSRHGIVHCQISTAEQLTRMKELGVFVMSQPIFYDSDWKILEERVGERARTSYAFGSLYRSGVSVSLGTDAPVEDLLPLPNLYCAISRTDLSGQPQGGLFPEHAFTLEEAIRAYTIESARQEGKGHIKGLLKEGYLADFIVLSENPFEKDTQSLLKNRVKRTVVGGRTVYEETHRKEEAYA